jgi:plasmid stabilization system protein ParE
MRSIIYSKTFEEQLLDYLEHGARTFGKAVAIDKQNRIYTTLKNVIAPNPGLKRHDPSLGLVVYPISKTPFFVLYDYDETQVRVHFIFIKGKPLNDIDTAIAEW